MKLFFGKKALERAAKTWLKKKRLETCRLISPQIYPQVGKILGRTEFSCECGFTVQSELYTMGDVMKCDRCSTEYVVSVAFLAEQKVDRSSRKDG